MSDSLQRYQNLFAFNAWANAHQLESLKNSLCEPALRQFSHLLAAEHNWLGRVQKARGKGEGQILELWPLYSQTEAENKAAELQTQWKALLQEVTPEELDHEIPYVTQDGRPYSTKLNDILDHVVTHSMHHRAQGQAALRAVGVTPQQIGYISYVRQQGA